MNSAMGEVSRRVSFVPFWRWEVPLCVVVVVGHLLFNAPILADVIFVQKLC